MCPWFIQQDGAACVTIVCHGSSQILSAQATRAHSKTQTSTREAGVPCIVCINSSGTVNPYQLGWGNTPKIKFPHASQQPALYWCLPEDSGLSPAMITFPGAPAVPAQSLKSERHAGGAGSERPAGGGEREYPAGGGGSEHSAGGGGIGRGP